MAGAVIDSIDTTFTAWMPQIACGIHCLIHSDSTDSSPCKTWLIITQCWNSSFKCLPSICLLQHPVLQVGSQMAENGGFWDSSHWQYFVRQRTHPAVFLFSLIPKSTWSYISRFSRCFDLYGSSTVCAARSNRVQYRCVSSLPGFSTFSI
jgi:hypothetical protein